MQGEAASELSPRLAGQNAFSRQRAEPHLPADARLASHGRRVYEKGGAATEVAACIGCHGERAQGSESLRRLAGQFLATLRRS